VMIDLDAMTSMRLGGVRRAGRVRSRRYEVGEIEVANRQLRDEKENYR
jgi:hypothetical protein